MKTIEIKAGERTRIIHKLFNSMPANYRFEVAPAIVGGSVSGIVEITGSSGFLPKTSRTQDLSEINMVEKSMMESFFGVYVVPDTDVKITVTGSFSKWIWVLLAVAFVVTFTAAVLLILFTG